MANNSKTLNIAASIIAITILFGAQHRALGVLPVEDPTITENTSDDTTVDPSKNTPSETKKTRSQRYSRKQPTDQTEQIASRSTPRAAKISKPRRGLLETSKIPKALPKDERGRPYGTGDGKITLFRPDKDERATFAYRDRNGRYNRKALDGIAQIFRCRLTDEIHEIDRELIELLDSIEDHFNASEIRLISTYRSPERNALMRSQGRRVARDSLHMYGKAVDIEIAGISKTTLRDYAYSLGKGGVGFYRSNSFVHVDVGPARTWGWNPPTKAIFR